MFLMSVHYIFFNVYTLLRKGKLELSDFPNVLTKYKLSLEYQQSLHSFRAALHSVLI